MEEINIKRVYSGHNFMYSAIIELTTQCNFNCKHCFIEKHTNYGMSTTEVFAMLEQLREFGVYEIQFTGGEIFMRRDIMEIINYARKLKFKVGLLTNVSLFTDDIIQQLEQLYVEVVSATLFSTSNEINDKITGVKNSATMVMENMKKLSKTKMRTEIKTVVMNDNADEVQKIKKFCDENNIYFLATEGLFPSASGDENIRKLAMTRDQLCRNIECLDKIRFGSLYKKEKAPNDFICCELHYSLFIDSYGDVYPCNLWFKKLGNIKNNQISDIWNCDFLNTIRHTTWKELKECFSCENKKYCIRCTGIVAGIKGDYLLSDPYACRTSLARQNVDSVIEK